MDGYDEIDSMIRYMLKRMRELAKSMGFSMFEEPFYYIDESLFEKKVRDLHQGTLEPYITFIDRGDHLLIVVDIPGMKEGTLDLRLYEDRIVVDAEADEKIVREAFGEYVWARRYFSSRRFHAEYSLPVRIDPGRARTERRGKTILIYAPKKDKY